MLQRFPIKSKGRSKKRKEVKHQIVQIHFVTNQVLLYDASWLFTLFLSYVW